MASSEKASSVAVVADDKDVWALLMYNYLEQNLDIPIIMQFLYMEEVS